MVKKWIQIWGMVVLALLCAKVRAEQPSALLVTKSSVSTPVPVDQKLQGNLEKLGFDVELKKATETTTGDAQDKDLIVISASINSGNVGDKFKNVETPVLCMESLLFDNFGMCGTVKGTDYGTAGSKTTLKITSSTDPMAAGFSGNVQVATSNTKFSWGKVNANARKIATLTGNSSRAVIFAYNEGAVMPGLVAPAPRTGFFLTDSAASALNASAWSLFEAAAVQTSGSVPVMLVVGNTTLNAMDLAMKDRLEGLGYLVEVADDDTVVEADTVGKTVVIVSDSVVGDGTLKSKLKNSTAPVINMDIYVSDNFGLIGTSSADRGTQSGQTQLTILNPGHVLATGLTGDSTVATSGKSFAWGKPNANATVVAHVVGDPGKALVYVYNAGATLADGSIAPNRRAGFFMTASGSDTFNEDGWRMFDALVDWSARKMPALFVVGNTTLVSADQAVKTRMEELGFEVTVKSDTTATTADATGKNLVAISSSVTPANITTKFKDVTVPVVTWESGLIDDMKFVAANVNKGNQTGQTQGNIQSAGHDLAAHRNGQVTLSSNSQTFSWGNPLPAAINVMTIISNGARSIEFAYEQGSAMQGMNAPARRVSLWMLEGAVDHITTDGWALFDAGMRWAVQVPPAGNPDDTDTDSLSDTWEMTNFGNLDQGPNDDPDGDGIKNIDEFHNGTNPNDFYNGVLPTVEKWSGNNQTNNPGLFMLKPLTIRVTTNSVVVPNAPIQFDVTQGGGLITTSTNGSPILSSTLNLRTDGNGLTKIYFQNPMQAGTTNKIVGKAVSGSSSASQTFTEYTGLPILLTKVSRPIISPNGGTYSGNKTVAITTADSGAEIRYTIDGLQPKEYSTLYTGPITVPPDTIVQARAFRSGNFPSDIAYASFEKKTSSSPNSIPDLELWLRAGAGLNFDGAGKVEVWEDQSGSKLNAVQTDPLSRPTWIADQAYGNPVLRFDGVNQLLKLPTGFTNYPSGLTALAVIRPEASKSGDGRVLRGAILDLGSSATANHILMGYTSTNQIINVAVYNGGAKRGFDVSKVVSSGIFQAIGLQQSGKTSSLYRNGDLMKSATTTNIVSIARSENSIGKSTFTGDSYLSGDLAELILYRRALTTAEYALLNGYLSKKYNLSTQLTETPGFTPNGQVFQGSVDVDIACGTPESVIHYTTNGTDPTDKSPVYSTQIHLTNPTTIKARAFAPGFLDSQIATATFEYLNDASPSTHDGVMFWLRSDMGVESDSSGKVSNWSDQSGYYTDAAQVDESAQPMIVNNVLNGHPVIRFNGTSQYLKLPRGFDEFHNGMTAFIVAQPERTSGRGVIMDLYSGNTISNNVSIAHLSTNLLHRAYTGNTNHTITGINMVKLGASRLFTIRQSGLAVVLQTNGVFNTSLPNNGIQSVWRDVNFIGKGSIAGDKLFQGDIAEMILFNRNLNNVEIKQISDSLGVKYGLFRPVISDPSILGGNTESSTNLLVTVTCDTPAAGVYYTTDGKTPTKSSKLYGGPIPITPTASGVKLRVKAFADGYDPSSTVEANYYWPSSDDQILFNPPSYYADPIYGNPFSVTLTSTHGYPIYYTTDGTVPTKSSSRYTGPISLKVTTTIKAVGIPDIQPPGINFTGYHSDIYKFTLPPPIMVPSGGGLRGRTLVITNASPTADIYYTLNGSNPGTSSSHYDGPITLPALPAIVRAKAYQSTFNASGIRDASFQDRTPEPVIRPGTIKTVDATVQVAIENMSPGSTVRFTKNGDSVQPDSPIYSSSFSVPVPSVVKAKAFHPTYGESSEVIADYSHDKNFTPRIFPSGGNYPTNILVTIDAQTTGVDVRYTTNGNDPSPTSSPYTGPFSISPTKTVKARAYRDGYNPSDIVTEVYTRIPATAAAPVPSLSPGSVPVGQSIALTTTTPSSQIRFTTDGSDPTASSTLYTAPIPVGGGINLKARTFSTGYNPSDLFEGGYHSQILPLPIFDPLNPLINADTQITLSSPIVGATIYYTTDGSIPSASKKKYVGPFTLSPPKTVKAIAIKSDWVTSPIVQKQFTTMVDTDGDGMDDAWERANFGDLSKGPDEDQDGDFISNRDEFRNDQDPTYEGGKHLFNTTNPGVGAVDSFTVPMASPYKLMWLNFSSIDNGLKDESAGKWVWNPEWNSKDGHTDVIIHEYNYFTDRTSTFTLYNDDSGASAQSYVNSRWEPLNFVVNYSDTQGGGTVASTLQPGIAELPEKTYQSWRMASLRFMSGYEDVLVGDVKIRVLKGNLRFWRDSAGTVPLDDLSHIHIGEEIYLDSNPDLPEDDAELAFDFSGTGTILAYNFGETPIRRDMNMVSVTDVASLKFKPPVRAKVQAAVDANRDQSIEFSDQSSADMTTSQKRYNFWINNDRDIGRVVDGTDWEEDDIVGSPDSSDGLITCRRDLEDFSRIWIKVDKDLEPNDEIVMRWESVDQGAPGINVYWAAESGGGLGYLTSDQIPQIYPGRGNIKSSRTYATSIASVTGASDVVIPLPPSLTWKAGQARYFLFEGTGSGSGVLSVSVRRSGQVVPKEQTENGYRVYLDLKDIKEMYERYTVGDGNGMVPGPLGHEVGSLKYGDPVTADDHNYILFVHGWNMEGWEKERYAETAFKRLWWQGYKGRFGIFKWPTSNQFLDGPIDEYKDVLFEPENYNNGELAAWRSGAKLKLLLVNLHAKYHLDVMAHSMGNVVMGEALRLAAQEGLGKVVDTYVASQAALPSHCYQGTLPDNLESAQTLLGHVHFRYNQPDIPDRIESSYGSSVGGGLFDYGPQSSNIYKDWLAGNSAAAGNRINFYNVNDYALVAPRWEFNQILKPNEGMKRFDLTFPGYKLYYRFTGDTEDPLSDHYVRYETFYYTDYGETVLLPPKKDLHLGSPNNLQDRYEIMAFASEARSMALGRSASVNGLASVSLQSIWPDDTAESDLARKWSAHKWHSAQFRMDMPKQKGYWRQLLITYGFTPTLPE